MLPVGSLRGYVPAVLFGALALIVATSTPTTSLAPPEPTVSSEPNELTEPTVSSEPSGPAVALPGPDEAAATADPRERARRKGNSVLSPQAKVPSFDVSAVARFVVMLGQTRRLSQPVGYGFGVVMRFHPWRAGATHLGFTFSGGHVRAPQLERLPPFDDPAGPLTPRWQRVAMSDFAGGLSLRAPLGPVVFSTDVGGGLAIAEFVRPTTSSSTQDERFESVDPTIRAGMWLGAPFRNNHGLVVGLALTKVFSGIVVENATGEKLSPLDLVTELSFGYQGWF